MQLTGDSDRRRPIAEIVRDWRLWAGMTMIAAGLTTVVVVAWLVMSIHNGQSTSDSPHRPHATESSTMDAE